MTEVGKVYGNALYELAKSENLSALILEEMAALDAGFSQEPGFLKLLSAPNLTKQERCQIVDDSFRGKVQPYLLNFLKILTENGYAPHFHACYQAYAEQYDDDNGIIAVTAKTAIPLSPAQSEKLSQKLAGITGKQIRLVNKVEPGLMGGVQLDLGNRRVEDTVAGRLSAIEKLLQKTTI